MYILVTFYCHFFLVSICPCAFKLQSTINTPYFFFVTMDPAMNCAVDKLSNGHFESMPPPQSTESSIFQKIVSQTTSSAKVRISLINFRLIIFTDFPSESFIQNTHLYGSILICLVTTWECHQSDRIFWKNFIYMDHSEYNLMNFLGFHVYHCSVWES